MTDSPTLFDSPIPRHQNVPVGEWRRTDPQTSVDAAVAITGRTEQRILDEFRMGRVEGRDSIVWRLASPEGDDVTTPVRVSWRRVGIACAVWLGSPRSARGADPVARWGVGVFDSSCSGSRAHGVGDTFSDGEHLFVGHGGDLVVGHGGEDLVDGAVGVPEVLAPCHVNSKSWSGHRVNTYSGEIR